MLAGPLQYLPTLFAFFVLCNLACNRLEQVATHIRSDGGAYVKMIG